MREILHDSSPMVSHPKRTDISMCGEKKPQGKAGSRGSIDTYMPLNAGLEKNTDTSGGNGLNATPILLPDQHNILPQKHSKGTFNQPKLIKQPCRLSIRQSVRNNQPINQPTN